MIPATADAHSRLASVPTMNRSRAAGVASSVNRPTPFSATMTAIAAGNPTTIARAAASRSR